MSGAEGHSGFDDWRPDEIERQRERGFLVDRSVFLAAEEGLDPGPPPPGEAHVSIATLTQLGIRLYEAADEDERRLRRTTLAKAHRFLPLPFDEEVDHHLVGIYAMAVEDPTPIGRAPVAGRFDVLDAIVAATAEHHGMVLWALDGRFEELRRYAIRLRVAGRG